jgi:ABC-type multidrug transport system ATPase subunit
LDSRRGDPAPGGPAVIEVQALRKAYSRGRIQAVRDISLRMARGEVFGLIGPDGAGKTSVLQVLAGVLRADAGTARVAGVDVLGDPEAIKGLVGYMPQGLGLNLYDSLTVAENIEFFRDLRRVPREEYRDNRARLLRMTRLERLLDRPAGKLSGGMRQKLALICTLIHLPDVLLLDEPTTGVDPISRRDFWSIVHTLVANRNVTVLLTTAYMDEAERCHRVSLMHAGAVIGAGTPEELTARLTGRVFALRSAHPDDVLDALRQVPAAQSATIAGAEVRLLVRDAVDDLTARLTAAGLAAVPLEPARPSLEDVFLEHLTRELPPSGTATHACSRPRARRHRAAAGPRKTPRPLSRIGSRVGSTRSPLSMR